MKLIWLKIAGGLYLIYLFYKFIKGMDEDKKVKPKPGFWATIVAVEIMDLSLSIDNIFAALAFTDKLWLIMLGVFIGIACMRFVAGWFIKLIEKYPVLNTAAFVVILLLGIKLVVTGTMFYIPATHNILKIIESHTADLIFSASMMLIFFIPLIFRKKEFKVSSVDY